MSTKLVQQVTSAAFAASDDQLAKALQVLKCKQQKRKLITSRQAADLLGLCPETVKRYGRNGILKPYRLGLRKLRFDKAEVEAMASGINE